MSFKLFFASTFGLIKSTEKIEAAYEALLTDYLMFCEFEKSSELKEYHELEILLKSATFLQRKKELQQLSLKGSKEEAQLKEFTKLGKNSRLLKFYALLDSEELKKFDKIAESELMAKYKKLKTAVEKHSLEVLKKKDKNSEEFALYTEYEKVKNSDEIVSFKKFRISKTHKNYETMIDSPERKQYEELKKLTASEEFKARVAYLEDKRKWEKTEESVKEKRFSELQKLPQLINYLKYKHSNAFDFFKKWDLVFEDRFEAGKLDSKKWLTQSHWASKSLDRNFSQVGDLHAFTDGKNVLVDGKSLKIEVRKERTIGMQWRIPFGFVEQDFDYSSGIVSTAGVEWWKHGILEVKVKYAPARNIVDAIYLLGEESSPQINLIEMGIKNRVGLFSKTLEGIHTESESLSGLKQGEFYIFRLEWSPNSLVWKINNREIFTISNNIPTHQMHLNAASVVVNEPTGNLPHRFEIDWVRFYKHKA